MNNFGKLAFLKEEPQLAYQPKLLLTGTPPGEWRACVYVCQKMGKWRQRKMHTGGDVLWRGMQKMVGERRRRRRRKARTMTAANKG